MKQPETERIGDAGIDRTVNDGGVYETFDRDVA